MPTKKWLLMLTMLTAGLAAGCHNTASVHGPNWKAMHDLEPGPHSFPVEAQGKSAVRVGDELKYTVRSSQAGRLWLLQVDSEDAVSLLYPNEHARDNTIEANSPLTLPPPGAKWVMEASRPVGQSVVAFIVTPSDVDLSDALSAGKDVSRALHLVQAAPAWGMTRKVVEVKEAPQ